MSSNTCESVRRREFMGLGAAAATSVGANRFSSASESVEGAAWRIPRKAARIIYLVQAGGPSHLDLFEDKPALGRNRGQSLPAAVTEKLMLTTMTETQDAFRLEPSAFEYKQYGDSGAAFSSLLPHLSGVGDALCFVRSMVSPSVNHNPGLTLLMTGAERKGRPSLGAWLSFALREEMTSGLPAFVAMTSDVGEARKSHDYLWSSGFLPKQHQAVKFIGGEDALFFLRNPKGITSTVRKRMLADVQSLVETQPAGGQDSAAVQNLRTALQLQETLPQITDFSDEPQHVLEMYGEDVLRPGTYAYNCLVARRLSERGVPAVQVINRDWDHHDHLNQRITRMCEAVDQPTAALVKDLQERSMLDDTLIVWGGEFGRTPFAQGPFGAKHNGRGHHSNGFTVWLAGGGVKPGFSFGETDELGLEVVSEPTEIHDLNATILHLMGINHRRLTYSFSGREFRLTDVGGKLLQEIIA